MNQTNEQLDRLNKAAIHVARGDDRFYSGLSKGERLYVAFAANRHDLLDAMQYTMVQAFANLEFEMRKPLLAAWMYKDPKDLRSKD